MPEKAYIAIDLKSFYASVECVERGLDPLTKNLVVADESRSTKTICLAATPAIKSYGVPGRARLFEVVQKVKEANMLRKGNAPMGKLEGESCDAEELAANPAHSLSYSIDEVFMDVTFSLPHHQGKTRPKFIIRIGQSTSIKGM